MAKKKSKTGITNWQKFGLVVLIGGSLAAVKFAFFPSSQPPVSEEPKQEEEVVVPKSDDVNADVPKSYVNVYFISQNKNKQEVYKIVKREYNSKIGKTKLKYSIENLLKGPNSKERAKGIYSEIPEGTKLISLDETPEKITINLSGDFEQGGGTDGLYKRLYQLIKTANKNTTLEVYLYINGKQADVVGGEGIMINQPLNENSLEE